MDKCKSQNTYTGCRVTQSNYTNLTFFLTLNLFLFIQFVTNLFHNVSITIINYCPEIFQPLMSAKFREFTVLSKCAVSVSTRVWDRVCCPKDNGQSSKKNNKYQLLYTYGCNLLMMGRNTPETCRA